MAPVQSKPTVLTLPRELRDIIYAYTLSEQIDIITPERSSVLRQPQLTPFAAPGLPLACKQLCYETLELYYRHGRFVIRKLGPSICWDALVDWLTFLPERYRQALQSVRGIRSASMPLSADNLGLTKLDCNSEGVDVPKEVLSFWIECKPPRD